MTEPAYSHDGQIKAVRVMEHLYNVLSDVRTGSEMERVGYVSRRSHGDTRIWDAFTLSACQIDGPSSGGFRTRRAAVAAVGRSL